MFIYRGRQEWLMTHPVLGDGNGTTFGFARVVGPLNRPLTIIFSDAEDTGWEHVSVSMPNKTPSWVEMAFVKDLFWDTEQAVMQLHPARSSYVNNHDHCLHLWRPTKEAIPLPPTILV